MITDWSKVSRCPTRPRPAGNLTQTRHTFLSGRGCHHSEDRPVGSQDTLGADCHCHADRACHHLDGNVVDRLAPRLPAAAQPALFHIWPGMPFSPTGVLLVVVRLRRLYYFGRFIHAYAFRRLSSAVRAFRRRWPNDVLDEGVTHCWQARFGWRSVDLFPPRLCEAEKKNQRTRSVYPPTGFIGQRSYWQSTNWKKTAS